MREKLNKQFLLGARNQAFVTEYVAGVETVKSLQFEPVLERRYGDYLSAYLAASFGTRNLANTYNVVANALEQLMTLGILVAGALLVMRNDGFTIGMLVAFQMFAARMAQPMLRIAGLWQEFQQASIAVKRLGDIMNAPAEPYSLAPSRATGRAGAIALQGVSFRYSERHPYLFRNVDFAIKPGELVVVSGPRAAARAPSPSSSSASTRPTTAASCSTVATSPPLRQRAAPVLRRGAAGDRAFLGQRVRQPGHGQPARRASTRSSPPAARPRSTTRSRSCRRATRRRSASTASACPAARSSASPSRARCSSGRGSSIFDEATSNLDAATAESLAQTVNQLKGKATILFIAHQVPPGLQVDRAPAASRAPLKHVRRGPARLPARAAAGAEPPAGAARARRAVRAARPRGRGARGRRLRSSTSSRLPKASSCRLGYLKIVQPAEQGVVKEIFVREGESVREGQVLMRMDAALLRRRWPRARRRLPHQAPRAAPRRRPARRAAAAARSRRPGRRCSRRPKRNTRLTSAPTATRSRRSTRCWRRRATSSPPARGGRGKLLQVLPHYREQESAFEKLAKDGFAGRLMYTDKQRERIEKEQDLKTQESTDRRRQRHHRPIGEAPGADRRRVPAPAAGRARRARAAGRAPARGARQAAPPPRAARAARAAGGTVKDLATHTPGTVVAPGTILMTIVPAGERLRAEVWVSNDDIGFVRAAQPVRSSWPRSSSRSTAWSTAPWRR